MLTAPHAPWQNAFVERLVGSARRECLDHVSVLNKSDNAEVVALLRKERALNLALDKDAPIPRPVMPASAGDIVAMPDVGGLHHRYERRAA